MAMLRAALYCRLSKDDMLQGDSESIKTQKAMLTQYAKEHGFLVVEIYVDDGYSGLNFDRPSFNRMLDDIEAGKIDVVITKDLSRLGRDHLKVGHFTEIYFPMKNVRYIAVNDGVDTANKNNDIAALKNVMNEFYSRDNSRKIRSSIRARAKAGLYRSSFNPIGYRKSPDNHNKLMVDEGQIALTPAVELSFLKKDEQENLRITMESEDATPSLSQAQRMKKLSQMGRLDMDTIFAIMTEEKANQRETVKIGMDKLRKYFPRGTTPKQIEDTILRLLERELQRKRNRDSR